MKKITVILLLLLYIMLTLTGCIADTKNYELKKPNDEIVLIELVEAKSSLDYSVHRVLSKEEMEKFLSDFSELDFSPYLFGDPCAVYGKSIKITYESGEYEIICYIWSEYIKNGKREAIKKFCDEDEYNSLINKYWIYEEPSSEYQDDIHIATP